jgi:hypothetical protein
VSQCAKGCGEIIATAKAVQRIVLPREYATRLVVAKGEDFFRPETNSEDRKPNDWGHYAWQHITHCSPCYASFLQSKGEFRTLRRRRGLGALAAGIAAIAVASAFTVYELNHRREQASIPGDETYEAAALDLKDSSPLRGPEVGPGNPVSRFLPNKKLDLAIYLPFGSEPGKYEIQLRKAGQALVTVEANAVLKQGSTDLHVKIDLSKYPPGGYVVALRQPPRSWRENPVSLR